MVSIHDTGAFHFGLASGQVVLVEVNNYQAGRISFNKGVGVLFASLRESEKPPLPYNLTELTIFPKIQDRGRCYQKP